MQWRCGLLLFLAGVIGCSGGAGGKPMPKLYSVSGILTIKGKPTPEVAVQLMPIDPTAKDARPASGITGADGRFIVSTNGKLGAVPGKYKVVLGAVSLKPMTLEDHAKISGAGTKTRGMPKPPQPFPDAWTNPKTSPLEHEVTTSATDLPIEI